MMQIEIPAAQQNESVRTTEQSVVLERKEQRND